MMTEFFLGRARIELSADGLFYTGSVPELPEIHARGATPEECESNLAEAIANLLAQEAAQANGNNSKSAPLKDFESAQINERQRDSNELKLDSRAGFSDIIYEKRDQIARITINRPTFFNSYTLLTLSEMTEAFRIAAADNEVAAVVLTGAGDKAFCAGSDVTEHSDAHINNPKEFRRWFDVFIEAHVSLRRLGKPSVARINGIAAGGGNGWNLACDLAIAADHAKFVHIETKLGMVSAGGPAEWLPLVIGERRAREMLLTSEPVSANKALLWGLVNDVVPYNELDDAVAALCRKLIDRFPNSARRTRDQLNYWRDLAWRATVEQDRDLLAAQFASDEAREGLRALAERREIDFRKLWFESHPEVAFEIERNCLACGTEGFPAAQQYCGNCGEKLI